MASIIDICNIALSELGNKAQVVSISPPDGTVEADLCARFYPVARDEMLEFGDWTFARKRATLAQLATNPSTLWAYAYAKPSDCLVTRRILSGVNEFKENDSADFDVEGDIILTDRADAVLIYTATSNDPTKYPPSFVTTVGYKLGAFLAGPIIRGEAGTNAAQALHKLAKTSATEALSTDANRMWRQGWYTPSMVAARGGNIAGTSPNFNDPIYPQSGYAIS